jgi:uncharacterized lipoprotein YmbA
MNVIVHFRQAALLLATCLALAGCIPVLDNQDTRFYVLGTLPTTSAPVAGINADEPLTIDLASVTIPQYLQRPQIVSRISENQLVLSEFDNWGGSLEKNMMRSLASNLATLLATPQVHIAARRVPSGTNARVEVEIMSYERGPDNRVRLEAQWRLLGGDRDRAPLRSEVTQLASEPLSDASVGASVAAMSELLGKFSTVVANAIVFESAR